MSLAEPDTGSVPPVRRWPDIATFWLCFRQKLTHLGVAHEKKAAVQFGLTEPVRRAIWRRANKTNIDDEFADSRGAPLASSQIGGHDGIAWERAGETQPIPD
jgi:hypothetical protein